MTASTHEVTNQAPPIAPYNVFEADAGAAARRSSARAAAGASTGCGTPASWRAAPRRSSTPSAAERNEPRLLSHDRYGNRVDAVELDPSWHWLLRQAIERDIHALPWRDPQPGAHVVRAALMLTWSQVNARRDVPGVDDLLRRSPRCARSPSWPASGSRGSRGPRTRTAPSPAWR